MTRTRPSVTLQHTARATDSRTAFYESSASNWGNNTGHMEEFEGYNNLAFEDGENRMLRKIFGPKGDELTSVRRKPHGTELQDLYSSPNIISPSPRGAAVQRGPGSPHSRGLLITQRRTTVGRTPLDE